MNRLLLLLACLLPLSAFGQVSVIRPPSGFLRVEGGIIATNRGTGNSTNLLDAIAAKLGLSGQIGGSLASPDIRGIRETGGPTSLTFGAVADGQLLQRSGLTIVGASAFGTGDVTASNTLTNGSPLLGAGTKSVIATNAAGFRVAVGLVIGTDVQAQGNYITALTGDVTGSGPGSIATTLANTAVTPGTFGSATKTVTATVDSKGRLTALTEQTATPAFASISGTPTTLGGYGITDALSASASSTQDGYFGNVNLRDDTSPSHYLTITDAENLTGNHTLSLSVGNADRALTLAGDATLSGSNTGDQTVTLTGDVTGSGTGSFATTLKNTGTAGTYTKTTFDAQGRETSGTAAVLASADFANQGTTTTVLHGNASGNPSFGAVALATDVSGTLAAAQFPALTGDVTTSAGNLATTIANDAITNAKLANMANATIKGRTTAGTGDPEDLTAAQARTILNVADGSTAGITALTGDVTATGPGSVAGTIANDAVTYAKMQNISATQRILGRNSAGSGDTEEVTLSQHLDWIGSVAQGDILYRDSSAWTRLGAGTSGQFLKTQGASANPLWADAPSGSGTVGTMINTTTPVLYDLYRAKDATTTNAEPSTLVANGSSLKLGHDAATPTAQLIIGNAPTGANTAGANLTVAAPSGTGIGTGGSLLLGMSVAGSSSSVTNPTVTGITIAQDAQIAAATATTIAGRLRIQDGTAALPSLVLATDDDASGTGISRSGSNRIGFSSNGSLVLDVRAATLEMVSAAILEWNGDSQFGRESGGVLQQGADAANPVNQVLKGPDGSGTDKNGGDYTFAGGQSTGTGTPGRMKVKSAFVTTTGSGQNAYTTSATVGGNLKVDTTTTGNVGGGEDNLITYTVPANQLGVNGAYLEFRVWGTCAANSNTKDIKVYFGSTVLNDGGVTVLNGVSWSAHGMIVRTGAATQTATCNLTAGVGVIASTLTTAPAETLSGTVVFKVTGTSAISPNDNDIVQTGEIISWNQGQ